MNTTKIINGMGTGIVLKHGKYLCAKFFYNLAVGIIEMSCIFLWLLGKFLNVEIDTFYSTTSECQRYIITIKENGKGHL